MEEEKQILIRDIKNKRTESSSLAIDIPNKEITVLSGSITQLKSQKENLENEIRALTSRFNDLNDISKLENRRTYLNQNIDELTSKNKQLESETERLSRETRQSNFDLMTKLLKIKPEVDVLCGLEPVKKEEPKNFKLISERIIIDIEQEREDIIDTVLDRLNLFGRKTDYDTVTNILITLAQSQFTLFSGLPGTGKTSFAKLIGLSIGLGNRLLNIPVARGWTSPRNILGFYNALSQSFVEAPTGMYEMLKQMNGEDKQSAPAIILLDEFNLSQPEHYFSQFMEMADPESSREIRTGDPELPTLVVPNYVRFLGTINNDESVQSLTPRMLDRAAIINFDDSHQVDVTSLNQLENIDNKIASDLLISGADFIRLFSPSQDKRQVNTKNLQEIIDCLRNDDIAFGNQIIVSHRKIKSIVNYCQVASTLMLGAETTALDYALWQHLLPLLNGYGEQFGKRLNKLLLLVGEYENTYKALSRLIANGKANLHSYGYAL